MPKFRKKDIIKDEEYHDKRRMRRLCQANGIDYTKYYPKNERKKQHGNKSTRAKQPY